MKEGWIEVVCGPMFCGKTWELIRRIRRARIAKLRVQVFKPALDDRYDDNNVVSHDGLTVDAIPVEDVAEMRTRIDPGADVIAVDEGQFFGPDLVGLCEEMADEGVRVIVAGLDMDFRGEPFGPMPSLLARAEDILKLTAICAGCGEEATRTQRLVDGRPAFYGDPLVVVGADEKYQARCRGCHEVPLGRPEPSMAEERDG